MTETAETQPAYTPPVPDDFKAEFPCPMAGCGRTFPSKNGLQGHMIAHRPPVKCPECGREYKTPGALGNHRKMSHGVIGPWASKEVEKKEPKKRGRPVGSTNTPKSKAQARIDWTPDEIFESVVRSLWPQGSVPVRCLVPLWEWREATVQFLEKVQSE